MQIRDVTSKDTDGLGDVLDATELFPREMLPALLEPCLAGASEGIWLACEDRDRVIGFCFGEPEEMTEGTWNMRAIAVLPEAQGHGAGRALVAALEGALLARGARLVIVDTSGQSEHAGSRAFYRRIGYGEEARLRDFWAAGDDKVTFRKALG